MTTSAVPIRQTADTLAATRFARFASGLELASVPLEVIAHAKLAILDAIGIALASTTFEFAHRAASGLAALARLDDRRGGVSPVIGLDLTLSVRDAIVMNGTLIHGLDFDDTHSGSVVHATASALPVALAHALARGATGADLLAAYLVAVETDARIGALAGGQWQQRGHHPTGMIAAYGAALAVARLMSLSEAQMVDAQGIVHSMASGNLEFLTDGDWTKRLHPGWAGVAATTAAALAGSGFKGPKRVYEGRYGIYNLHLGPEAGIDASGLGADLGDVWEMLDVAFKPYPACHFNHAFADAALALRTAHGIEPARIARIVARLHERQVEVVCEPRENKRQPTSPYDAQFSLPYVVAAALVRGRFTLDELEPGTLSDPAILGLAARVDYEIDAASAYPRHFSGELVIALDDGTELVHREAVNRGARDNPLPRDDLLAKFFANAERATTRVRAERIVETVMQLESLDDLALLQAAIVR